MIFGAVCALSSALALLCYLMAPGMEIALAGMVSILLVTAGLALKRYAFVLISSGIITITYLGIVLSETGPFKVWNALFAGLLLFLVLEVGYDATTCIRSRISWRAYGRRGRYLATICALSLISVFVFVTIAYNVREHIPTYAGSKLVIPALYLLVAGLSTVVVLALRNKKK